MVEGFAEFFEQDKPDADAGAFVVGVDGVEQIRGGEVIGDLEGEAKAIGEEIAMEFHGRLIEHAEAAADACGEHHADGDGVAVGERAGGDFFEGVAEGVAVFESHGGAAFGGIGLENPQFGEDGVLDEVMECVRLFLKGGGDRGVEILKLCGISDQGIFDGFDHAAAEAGDRFGEEQGGIGPDKERCVKGAENVFRTGAVDGLLVAEGAVGLGHEGGGEVGETDAAEEEAGGESDEIGDSAAAEGEQEGIFGSALAQQFFRGGFEDGEGFAGFALGNRERADVRSGVLQMLCEVTAMESVDAFIADEEEAVEGAGVEEFGDAVERAVAEQVGTTLFEAGVETQRRGLHGGRCVRRCVGDQAHVTTPEKKEDSPHSSWGAGQ